MGQKKVVTTACEPSAVRIWRFWRWISQSVRQLRELGVGRNESAPEPVACVPYEPGPSADNPRGRLEAGETRKKLARTNKKTKLGSCS